MLGAVDPAAIGLDADGGGRLEMYEKVDDTVGVGPDGTEVLGAAPDVTDLPGHLTSRAGPASTARR